MIYLAAPYSTGIEPKADQAAVMAARRHKINAAAALLMQEGHVVYSPISHGDSVAPHLPGDKASDHQFWMKQCIGMLDRARELCVLQLDGWEDSQGVLLEIKHAKHRGIPITYMGDIAHAAR